jgi:hypothetical protein
VLRGEKELGALQRMFEKTNDKMFGGVCFESRAIAGRARCREAQGRDSDGIERVYNVEYVHVTRLCLNEKRPTMSHNIGLPARMLRFQGRNAAL